MWSAEKRAEGAGVHAPQAEFTFRTYCRQTFPYRIMEGLPVIRPSDKGAYQERLPTWRTRLAGLVKADAVEQVREARVAAHRIKERMHF